MKFVKELEATQASASTQAVMAGRTVNASLPLRIDSAANANLTADRTLSIGGLSAYGAANTVMGMTNAATGMEWKAFAQAANQGVTIAHSANTITLGTAQDIRTSASPSFTGLTVSSLGAGATNTVVTHSSGVLQARTIDSRVWGSSNVVTASSGTLNYVSKWTATGAGSFALGNSAIFDNAVTVGINNTGFSSDVSNTYELAPELWIASTTPRWSHLGGLIGGLSCQGYAAQTTWGRSSDILADWTFRGGTLTATSSNANVTIQNADYVCTGLVGQADTYWCAHTPAGAGTSSTVATTGVILTFDFDSVLYSNTWQRLHQRWTGLEQFRPLIVVYNSSGVSVTNVKVTISASSDGTYTNTTIFTDYIIHDSTINFRGGTIWLGPSAQIAADALKWIRRVKFEITINPVVSTDMFRIAHIGLLSNMPTDLDRVRAMRTSRWSANQVFISGKGLSWEPSSSTGPWESKQYIWTSANNLNVRAPHSNGRVILGWDKAGTSTAVVSGVYESSVHKFRPESLTEPVQLGDSTYYWNGIYLSDLVRVNMAATSSYLAGFAAGDTFNRTLLGDGHLKFGPGNATQDILITRAASYLMDVSNDVRILAGTTGTNNYALNISKTFTSARAAEKAGLYVVAAYQAAEAGGSDLQQAIRANPTFTYTSANPTTSTSVVAYATFSGSGGSSTAQGFLSGGTVGTGHTVSDFRHFVVQGVSSTGTLTAQTGVYVPDMSGTSVYGYRSLITSGANKYSIVTGTAISSFGGQVQISTGTTTPLVVTTSSGAPWSINFVRSDLPNTVSLFNNNAQLYTSDAFSATLYVSRVAIGTSPVQVTSTTLCTNLNADLLDNQHGSYYLDTSSGAQTKAGNLMVSGNFYAKGLEFPTGTKLEAQWSAQSEYKGPYGVLGLIESCAGAVGVIDTFRYSKILNPERWNGTAWSADTVDYSPLISSKNAKVSVITSAEQATYTKKRFTVDTGFAWSRPNAFMLTRMRDGADWSFYITIELSNDNSAWTTWINSVYSSSSYAYFFHDDMGNARYVRITIEKGTTITAGSLAFIRLRGLNQQGPGVIYQPFTISDKGEVSINDVNTGTAGSNISLTLSGNSTNTRQIRFGDVANTIQSAVGTQYSSGSLILAHNALQTGYSADQWTQPYQNASAASALLELGGGSVALRFSRAAPLTANNGATTFWSQKFLEISSTGVFALTTVTATYGIVVSCANDTGQTARIGYVSLGRAATQYPYVGYGFTTDNSINHKYSANDFAAAWDIGASGAIVSKHAASGTAGNAITWTTRLSIPRTGSVTIDGTAISTASDAITGIATSLSGITLTRSAGNLTAMIEDALSLTNVEGNTNWSYIGAFMNNALTNCVAHGATLTTSTGGTAGVVIQYPTALTIPVTSGSRDACMITMQNGGTATFEYTGVTWLDTAGSGYWEGFVLARTAATASAISNVKIECRDNLGSWVTMFDGAPTWRNLLHRSGSFVVTNYPPNGVRFTITFNTTGTGYLSEAGIWHKNYVPGRGMLPRLNAVNRFHNLNYFTSGLSVYNGVTSMTGNTVFQVGAELQNGSASIAQFNGSVRVNQLVTHVGSGGDAIFPNSNGVGYCGGPSNRWQSVYSVAGNFTGTVTVTGNYEQEGGFIRLNNTDPRIIFYESDVAAGYKRSDFVNQAGQFVGRFYSDDGATSANWLVVSRASGTPTSGAIDFYGTTFTHTGGLMRINHTAPRLSLYESDAAVDNRYWDFAVDGTVLYGNIYNDVYGAGGTWLQVTRSGTTITGVYLTGTTVQSNGSAIVTNNGNSYNISLSRTTGQLASQDNRLTDPADINAGYAQFVFGAYNNNNAAPYADCFHLRGWSDSSGGSDNLVMFLKTGIGMRIWQQTFGSTTAYATYKSVLFSDGTYDSGLSAFGSTSTTFCVGNDSRLSDARTPLSHTHGNITNAGAIGSTANLPVITTTSGVLTTGTFGSAANTFCQGNDSRLSDARTPTAHASSHAAGGSDALAWTTIHGKGDTASRPAAASTNSGYLYANTSTNTLQRSTGAAWEDVATLGAGGGGTVTSVSVVTANGFAGTVATASTTPAITLTTTITGVLKGNGTAISAAVSGTDYAPATSGASILKGNGAGGFSNAGAGTDYVSTGNITTTNGLLINTNRLAGRGTAGSGNLEEMALTGSGGISFAWAASSLTVTMTSTPTFSSATISGALTTSNLGTNVASGSSINAILIREVTTNRVLGASSSIVRGWIDAAQTSHSHGNISSTGAIGVTSDQVVITTTSGVLTTQSKTSLTAGTGLTFSSGSGVNAVLTTGTLGIATNGVGNAQFRQSAGCSVVGRSAGTTGDVADITAGADGTYLTRSGGALTWAAISVAYSNVGSVTTSTLLGRTTAGTGAAELITVSSPLTLSAGALGVTRANLSAGTGLTISAGSGTNAVFVAATLGIAANGVGNNELRTGLATSVIGRSASTGGNVADIQASTDRHVLRRNSSLEFGYPIDVQKSGGTNYTGYKIVFSSNGGSIDIQISEASGVITVDLDQMGS